MLTISNRSDRMPFSPIRKLVPFANEAEKRGIKIYHLNIGQPDVPSPEKALEAVRNIKRKTLEYSPSEGFEDLRQKLARYYAGKGIDVTPDQIILTDGASEAVLLTFLTIINPGDEIIVEEPTYANYLGFAVSAGARIRPVTAKIENGFALPPTEEIEDAITEKTKAILICNPSNPTGYVYTEEELEKIRRIAYKYQLWLISDEAYREYNFTGKPSKSVLQLPSIEKNAILLDSFSKRYSECGIRVGMVVTRNEEIRYNLMKYCQARLSPPLLGQIAAAASIEGTEDYSAAVYEEYKARRDFFIDALNRIPGVYSPKPEGAFYTVASLPVDDAEDFCKWCLTDFSYDNSTVMMAPAAGFYATPGLGKNQVRLADVLEIPELRKALDVLSRALAAYNSR